MRVTLPSLLTLVASCALILPASATAQSRLELGFDGGAVFGLGDQSSIRLTVPGSRIRAGFFQAGSRFSLEPAVGFSYNKVKGTDGVFTYDLQFGLLYHFSPVIFDSSATGGAITRVTPIYLRPFIGLDGFSGGDASDSEFSAGVGLGAKVPWRRDLALRFEANLGYGFDNEAARIGVFAGLSYFPR